MRSAIAALLFILPTLASAEVPASLAPYMTADEFRAAGLHRLTPAEREAFEHWFLRTVGADAPPRVVQPSPAAEPPTPAAPPSSPAAEADALAEERRLLAEERRAIEEERRRLAEREPDLEDPRLFGFGAFASRTPEVEARIDGRFTGWSRGTRFRLDNGQVWEVTTGDAFRPVRPLDSPHVTIRRMTFGSFGLRVEGYNATARVRRIE